MQGWDILTSLSGARSIASKPSRSRLVPSAPAFKSVTAASPAQTGLVRSRITGSGGELRTVAFSYGMVQWRPSCAVCGVQRALVS